MLINIEDIKKILLSLNININGCFHVGAHECEELPYYTELGILQENIVWIDAIDSKVNEAIDRGIPNVYNAVISDKDDEEIIFNISNNVQSSSILEFATHSYEHPSVIYVDKIKKKSITIDTFFERNNLDASKYNFWNFDIQGVELLALKGAIQSIKYAKVLYLEVNEKELYKDCALITDIDNFLSKYNFKRVFTIMTPHGWGDALYILDKFPFNNCDSNTNGENKFFMDIKNNINIIFDVGCRTDSIFSYFNGEVHYFDPMNEFIETLKNQKNMNNASYFNNFGLGSDNNQIYYYPKYQSFYDRINSCNISDEPNKILLYIKKGKDYVINNNIKNIDFLKIDTEGYELNVLQGFEDFLENIKIIQFEYGGTFLDNNTKLIDIINYLEKYGFYKFSYLTNNGPMLITDFNDHYQYCNIVCINKNINFIPF